MPNLHQDEARAEMLETLTEDQAEAMKIEFERLQYDARKAMKRDGEAFAVVLSDFVNNMNTEPVENCAAQLAREHRTLQQNAMRFCLFFIQAMAKNDTDLRNEDSVALAKRIMAMDGLMLRHV